MNEHDELEPTVAVPRVGQPPQPDSRTAQLRPQPIPPQPAVAPPWPTASTASIPPQPAPRPAYVFGNPLTYALRRFLAFCLDFGIITAVSTMLLYGLIAINPFTGLPNNSEGGFDATVGMGVAIAFVSVWLLESIFGVTLGKLAFSLHVYAPKHRIVGFGRALIRNLLRPIDLFVIGWILAMAPGHRRLGDLLGGTLVARSPLRSFSPLVGWILIIALGAVPFLVAGGPTTVLAVGAAFIEFIPPLIARVVHAALTLFGVPAPHAPGATG